MNGDGTLTTTVTDAQGDILSQTTTGTPNTSSGSGQGGVDQGVDLYA
ncbi:hypothetical protein AAC691_16690 [Nguyenibacter vanlangensis]|uniref:Uncharacterized protein n=1 Tax=Nguyenibacter vanlangensis TaxID=1216886 RepID=A0ABZ3D2B0_9PROT